MDGEWGVMDAEKSNNGRSDGAGSDRQSPTQGRIIIFVVEPWESTYI